MTDDPGMNGLLGTNRGTLASELPGPNQGFRGKGRWHRYPHDDDLAADGRTPLWEYGPWVEDENPWIKGKDWDLRRFFGLTIHWFADLYFAQDQRCPGCRRRFRFTWERTAKPLPPHVDHDHDTGEIRGLLCGRCNQKLSQRLTRYVKNPPARKISIFIVPRKQRAYGMELYAKRVRRQQLAVELAELELTFGPPTHRPPSTSSEP